jgi:hypothetical protein
MDEFIGTTSLERKRLQNQDATFFFRHSKYREPIYRLIPVNGGINHSPPYLIGVSPLGSNKHRRTSEEDERKKEYGPA